MNSNLAAGLGVVVVAVVGGLGWKAWQSRQLKKSATTTIATALANTPEATRAVIVEKVMRGAKIEPIVTDKLDGAATCIEDAVSVTAAEIPVPTITPHPEVNPDDVVTTLKTGGAEVLSVSRVRIPEDGNNKPLFWEAGLRKIRRTDIIKLDEASFMMARSDFARGFHLCEYEGMSGIMHVTKGNRSVVVLDAAGEFHGISTSASKFGGRKLSNITPERAKVFLNGN